jgi:lipopolysaccharide/colanic/teichoic acid biosynthesis glycosyltransferase
MAATRPRSRERRVDAHVSIMPHAPWLRALPEELTPAAASRMKRTMDLVISVALLTLTAPIWLAIAVAIKASSPGPVLFRQERIGLNGQPFTMLKFRSMRDGVSAEAHRSFVQGMIRPPSADAHAVADGKAVYKLSSDARTTPVGRFLRRTSLDELPQLINVVRGEMSLVGPRPPLRYEVDNYEPWQHARLSVRPGMTGVWQVSDRYHLPYYEMCRLDVEYVRSWSLARDLQILLRTPAAMISRDGARP